MEDEEKRYLNAKPCASERNGKATLTLIINGVDVICGDPVYTAQTGFGRSYITAWPGADVRLGEVCYIALKYGRMPVVVVAVQKDGSIRLSSAYVNSIARELGLMVSPDRSVAWAKGEDWMRAMDDGWPSPDGEQLAGRRERDPS